MNIYLIRHGETNYNLQHKIQGRTDTVLNETGIKQAKIAKEQFNKLDIDLIICSTLTRAKQTTSILNEDKQIKTIYSDLLVERNFGILEGEYKTEEEFKKLMKDDSVSVKDMETLPMLYNRAKIIIDKVIKEYNTKNVCIVTHGGFALALEKYIFEITNSNNTPSHLDNCEIRKYTIN